MSARWLVLLLLCTAPLCAQTEFKVDRDGHVYWLDGFGQIKRDGVSTGWRPRDASWRLDEAGHAVYVDSFDRMCKDGSSYSGSVENGGFGSGPDGTLYWVNSFSSELMREDEHLGYKASWQSAIRADGAGNIYYVNPETQTLWRNGDDLEQRFLGLDFLVAADGTLYYRSWLSNAQSNIWKFDPATRQTTFVDRAHNPPFLTLDREGRPWYVSPYGRVMRDRQPMYGVTWYGPIRLDDAGHLYTSRDGRILRDGAPTAYGTEGHFAVDAHGNVFSLVDASWGKVERNGVTLPFEVR